MLDRIKNLLYHHIGILDESCLKHRTAILFISAVILFTDPDITITFSGASLAGLGITIDPPQTIPVGTLLLAILLYRLIALWVSAVLNSGTNLDRTRAKIKRFYDPDDNEPSSISDYIDNDTANSVYHWETRRVLWEFALPNIAAIACIIKYVTHYIQNTT